MSQNNGSGNENCLHFLPILKSRGGERYAILLFLQFAGSSRDELQHIRQVVGFLVDFLEPK